MKIVELQPIREWEEKNGDKPTGNVRLYFSNMHIGTCYLYSKNEELYTFDSYFTDIMPDIQTKGKMTIPEIKNQVELAWKEFAVKFVKKITTLKKTP